MKKDFLTITPGSGSGNGSLNVVAAANTEAARSTTVNIGGSGISKTVTVSQEKGAVNVLIAGWYGTLAKIEIPR